MKFSGEVKFIIGIVAVSVVIVGVAIMLLSLPAESLSRSDLLPKETITKGQENAKVYLVEFSDFQCPACKAYQPIIDKLVDKYNKKIIFGYRHFPLPKHQFAFKAAEAAEAAGEQGKFWEMYEYIFQKQEQLSDELITNSGKAIGLDERKFQESLSSGKHKERIAKDMSDGKSFGVDSTPTFFLNGKKLNPTSFNDLENSVEDEINSL